MCKICSGSFTVIAERERERQSSDKTDRQRERERETRNTVNFQSQFGRFDRKFDISILARVRVIVRRICERVSERESF